ncbi:hypothetical protein HQ520_02620 [bacterium]|nr:hypothetical protein [bacterium]
MPVDLSKLTHDDVITLIFEELAKAENKHPGFPVDPIHAAAILAEEAGETVQASLDYVYHAGSLDEMAHEAAQTAAMGLRFLLNLKHYRRYSDSPCTTEGNLHVG